MGYRRRAGTWHRPGPPLKKSRRIVPAYDPRAEEGFDYMEENELEALALGLDQWGHD